MLHVKLPIARLIVATGQGTVRGKRFFKVKEKCGNQFYFESGKIDILKKSQGTLK